MRTDEEIIKDLAMTTIRPEEAPIFDRKEKAFMEVLLDIRNVLMNIQNDK